MLDINDLFEGLPEHFREVLGTLTIGYGFSKKINGGYTKIKN